MKSPYILICFFLHSLLSFAQQPYYYSLNGKRNYLQITSKSLIQTNSSFSPSQINSTHIEKQIEGRFIIDDPSLINNWTGIDYVTSGYLTGSNEQLFVTKDITFLLRENITARERDSIYKRYNLTFIKKTASYELVRIPISADALKIAAEMVESGAFIYATPNFLIKLHGSEYIPNDTYFNQQWYLHNTGQGTNDGKSTTVDADIDAPEAWEITKGSPNVIIAVLDKGITSNHPDLPDSRQIRLNGSNFAYQYDGLNANNPSPTISSLDGYTYHGDACAGIIGATQDNNEGISGIAPLCKILPVKVPLDFWADLYLYTDALAFARNSPATIISSSWNGTMLPSLEIEMQLCIQQGKVVIFSAGNSANHAMGDTGSALPPADFDEVTEMIVVGASDRNNHQANYSPSSGWIDIVAPSHTAYWDQIEGAEDESYNVWTLDNLGADYGQNSWRDNTTMTPQFGESLPSTGSNYQSYTGRFGGTSAAAPMIAGAVALMRSVNPCMSVQNINTVLKMTSDKIGGYNYNWNPNRPGHSLECGYGKLNAFQAVLLAQELNTQVFDLFMRDNAQDIGLTGIHGTGGGGDKSPDIWVRNFQDGGTVHQNPEFSNNNPCYVYVKVTNKSCHTSTGINRLKLYWSKAASSSSWPENWDGSDPGIGNIIGDQIIPELQPNESVTIVFPWSMLNPHTNNTWNSCLLARIESATDSQSNYSLLADDITENNNVSIRNVTIVDLVQGLEPHIVEVLSGNVTNEEQIADFHIDLATTPSGKPNIFSEAEVTFTFDQVGWDIFKNSGAFNTPGVRILKDQVILITDSMVRFSEITFPPKTRIPIRVDVHFLAKKITPIQEYAFTWEQYESATQKKLGTETFEIIKHRTDGFTADAGSDVTTEENTVVNFIATAIPDEAIYNWYNENDSLIYSGNDFSQLQTISSSYKLEVIRLDDGTKDYDQKIVNVTHHYLTSISPVPASEVLTVHYNALECSAAYLHIVNVQSGSSADFMLDTANQLKVFNVSNWQNGLYTLYFISEGQILEAETISIFH